MNGRSIVRPGEFESFIHLCRIISSVNLLS